MSDRPDPPQAAPDTSAARWAEATKRVRAVIDHGEHVGVVSIQLALLLLVVFLSITSLSAIIASPTDATTVVRGALVVMGVALAAAAWIRARRSGTLSSLWPWGAAARLLEPLSRDERRSLGRQLQAREEPTGESAPLVRALVERGRAANATHTLSLTGMFSAALGVLIGWGWQLALFVVVAALLVTGLIWLENSRLARALANADRALNRGSAAA